MAATGGIGPDLTVSAQLINQGETGASVAAGLLKTGAGTMLLSNTNSYTGGTTISAGVLQANSYSSLGSGTA